MESVLVLSGLWIIPFFIGPGRWTGVFCADAVCIANKIDKANIREVIGSEHRMDANCVLKSGLLLV
jgi:hypothetical protein